MFVVLPRKRGFFQTPHVSCLLDAITECLGFLLSCGNFLAEGIDSLWLFVRQLMAVGALGEPGALVLDVCLCLQLYMGTSSSWRRMFWCKCGTLDAKNCILRSRPFCVLSHPKNPTNGHSYPWHFQLKRNCHENTP